MRHRCALHPHHRRRHGNQCPSAADGRQRLPLRRHGSVEPRRRPEPHSRPPVRRRHLHQPHPRPSRLPQDCRRLYPRQEKILRQPARGRLRPCERRRFARKGDGAEHPREGLRLLAAHARRLQLPRARKPPRQHHHGHQPHRADHPLHRPLQCLQPHRRVRCPGASWGERGRIRRRNQRPAPRVRTFRDPHVGRRCDSHHRLRPHARRPGKRARSHPCRVAAGTHHHCDRCRRQPRPRQASADGRRGRFALGTSDHHQRQSPRRRPPRDSPRHRGRSVSLCRPLRHHHHHRPRRGHRHSHRSGRARRRGARGRQRS